MSLAGSVLAVIAALAKIQNVLLYLNHFTELNKSFQNLVKSLPNSSILTTYDTTQTWVAFPPEPIRKRYAGWIELKKSSPYLI
eukprot:7160971-Ditylum_brightwellii.AAC.1